MRLPVHLGQHHVRLGLGEEAAALDRRQLRRIAQHQHRHAERQEVAAELGVDHRAFVDDDQLGLGRRRLIPQVEARDFLAALARAVDQAVDGGGAAAALAAHHRGRLAGEGGELHLAVGLVGQMLGERGLAGAGIAEQAEDLVAAVRARLGFEPIGHGFERLILDGGELRHGGKPIKHGGGKRKNKKRTYLALISPLDIIPSTEYSPRTLVCPRPRRRRGARRADRVGAPTMRTADGAPGGAAPDFNPGRAPSHGAQGCPIARAA